MTKIDAYISNIDNIGKTLIIIWYNFKISSRDPV